MFDRDYALGGVALRGSPARGFTVDVRHQRRAFGANGFYGNSPSKEWTDGTIGSLRWQRTSSGWTTSARGLVRNHGDHFLWDIARPGFAENRHRTNAFELTADARRQIGATSIAFGASGGADRVKSSNLGNRDYARLGAFAEVVMPIGSRTTLQGGARLDDYSTFGASLSPTASFVTAVTEDLRVRASMGHAFRIPTFTELYYSDPNTLGNEALVPEQGWTVDGGADWTRGTWTVSGSVFRRWDSDVIDFVRASAAERYRATNVRDVNATGVEASVARRWARALVRVYYAGLDVDAPALDLQSRYVLEYAKHQTGASVALPVAAGLRVAVNVDHRVRRDGQRYGLVGARLSRSFGRVDVYVDGTNLLDETYTEIAGVAMPGRWLSGGLTIR
jgi:iron complex outermembrane receptor protein